MRVRVRYLGSRGCWRGRGRGRGGKGRKGRDVVVFGLSEGCVECFSAGRGSIRCHLPLCLWYGRVADVGSLLELFSVGFGIALVGPVAPIIPVEEDTIPAEMTVDDFAWWRWEWNASQRAYA